MPRGIRNRHQRYRDESTRQIIQNEPQAQAQALGHRSLDQELTPSRLDHAISPPRSVPSPQTCASDSLILYHSTLKLRVIALSTCWGKSVGKSVSQPVSQSFQQPNLNTVKSSYKLHDVSKEGFLLQLKHSFQGVHGIPGITTCDKLNSIISGFRT